MENFTTFLIDVLAQYNYSIKYVNTETEPITVVAIIYDDKGVEWLRHSSLKTEYTASQMIALIIGEVIRQKIKVR